MNKICLQHTEKWGFGSADLTFVVVVVYNILNIYFIFSHPSQLDSTNLKFWGIYWIELKQSDRIDIE